MVKIPPECSFSGSNWNVLARYWHPVAYSHEIVDTPIATQLLDLRLVLFRDANDRICVANNRCPHRGASLAEGWLENGQLVCAYHGLKFDSDGACVRIPAAGDRAKIPAKLCLDLARAEEKYGIVWVCLSDNPMQSIPAFDAWETKGIQRGRVSTEWHACPMRHAENFNDVAHAAWIHAETFAPREYPEMDTYKVTDHSYGLSFELPTTFLASNTFEAKRKQLIETSKSTYHIFMPFTTHLKVAMSAGEEHIFDTVQPLTAEKIRIFQLKTRNFDLHSPADDWIAFQEMVNEEDRITVENQQPLQMPLDLSEDFHLRADAFSVAYRRKLLSIGLA